MSKGIGIPSSGKLYHGVFPGGQEGDENAVTPDDLTGYRGAVGNQDVAWIYFSHEWGNESTGGPKFPSATVKWIKDYGASPFIRLMLRSTTTQSVPEPLFTLQSIVDGKFDSELKAWSEDAANSETRLICEFGTEVNGKWFPWNGIYNGFSKGPALFKRAYQHIVDKIRDASETDITWVYHVNHNSDPDTSSCAGGEGNWNSIESYDPGLAYADWIGLSIYGSQRPDVIDEPSFSARIDKIKPQLISLAKGRPIMLCEFAFAKPSLPENLAVQQNWIRDAFDYLLTLQKDGDTFFKGFSWWNESWINDDNVVTEMRVQNLESAVQQLFARFLTSDQIVDRPIH